MCYYGGMTDEDTIKDLIKDFRNLAKQSLVHETSSPGRNCHQFHYACALNLATDIIEELAGERT